MTAVDTNGETAAEYLARIMAQTGFEPSRNYNLHYIEYSRTYADAQGRMARAVVQFERPSALTPPGSAASLSGFTVLVQAQIAPTVEAVTERAPPVVQKDLLAVLAAFQTPSRPPPITFERCTTCKQPISEFFVHAGRVYCRNHQPEA